MKVVRIHKYPRLTHNILVKEKGDRFGNLDTEQKEL